MRAARTIVVALTWIALANVESVALAQSVDAPVDLGEATLVSETRQELSEGGGSTVFGFRLPSGASCPGDSEHDQWRVQTFIVPSTVDPATLTYDSIGPKGDGLYALYGTDTNPQVHGLTASNRGPGLPGLIVGLRSMSFEVFPPGTLGEGTYRIGVACTYFRGTASYWDTVIEISRDPEDQPAELRWESQASVDPRATVTDSAGSNAGTFGLVVVAGAATVGALAYLSRRFRRPPSLHQEKS